MSPTLASHAPAGELFSATLTTIRASDGSSSIAVSLSTARPTRRILLGPQHVVLYAEEMNTARELATYLKSKNLPQCTAKSRSESSTRPPSATKKTRARHKSNQSKTAHHAPNIVIYSPH